MGDYQKPLPIVDADSQPFWEGCKRHELSFQRCTRCGTFRFPPRNVCPDCMALDHEWVRASGRGKIHSFVVVHQAFGPAWKEDVPYPIAIVELDNGIRLITRIVGRGKKSPDSLQIGLPVEVCFEDIPNEITLPFFQPTDQATQPS